MENGKTQANQASRRIRLIVYVSALTVAFTISLPHPVYAAGNVMPPPVPPNLEVPEGNQAFLEGHAIGTQNYICLPSGPSVAWTLFGPQATLFNDHDRQIITHFLSSNPDESGMARATWQHSRDTSTVWAMAIASSSDPNFVEPGAIPWLLLQVVGTEPGRTGGERLTRTTFIQRLETSGGIAPLTGCAQSADVGQRAFVPYTADYIFYKAVESQ
jgi:Protein of unknown function (DUF3455)